MHSVLSTLAASYTFLAEGNRSHLSTFDWAFSAKVMITTKANLDTVANRGFEIGLMDQVEATATACRFIAGNDQANWQVLIGATLTNSGVAASDSTWYDLQMVRLSQSVTAYINGALVATTAHNVNMSRTRRRIGAVSPGAAAAGEGFRADYFRAWFKR